MKHTGSCHCGAIEIELETDRAPHDQVLGACQCSFCRKHNARTFSDPQARVTLIARQPEHIQSYAFGLMTSQQILCSIHLRGLVVLSNIKWKWTPTSQSRWWASSVSCAVQFGWRYLPNSSLSVPPSG